MQQINKLVSPYINTTLYTTIALKPNQLNNNLYSNIKQNLIKTYEKRNYLKYGYIDKVYEILERDNGFLINEDNESNVYYKIKFSCSLLHVCVNQQIIAAISLASVGGMFLKRGILNIIITHSGDRINSKVFELNTKENKIIVKNTGEELTKGTFVKVTIISVSMVSNQQTITAIASLDDIVSDDELEEMYKSEYTHEKDELVDYEEYIKQFD